MALLNDKVALITGGGGALGRAAALLLAEHGAKVVVNDLGTAPDGTGRDETVAQEVVAQICERGGHAVASVHDVRRDDQAAAAVELAVDRFGRLDILVNHAGITVQQPLLDLDLPGWQRLIDVDLTGTLCCLRQAARQMIHQGQGGRIVNTTSTTGLLGGAGQGSYATAKAGVYGLTRTAAVELQRHGITVNAVAPTAQTRLTADWPQLDGLEHLTPAHVAPAVLFFCSELCGDRSGEVLAVAGPRISRLRLAESPGKVKDAHAPWTAEEIAEHFGALGRP